MVIPIAAFLRHWRLQSDAMSLSKGVGGIVMLAVLASIWTMPWDNLMVLWGVWSYPDHVVLGKVFLIPLEEQLFFVVQPLFTGVWFLMLYPNGLQRRKVKASLLFRTCSALLALGVGALFFYLSTQPGYLYLGSFCAWFSIPIAIQWAYGSHLLSQWPRELILGTLPPTIYLCILDSFAINHRVWAISEEHTIGLFIGTLPIEEVTFFLFTNLLVIQGLSLLYDLIDQRKSALETVPSLGGEVRVG